jgi:UDP-N-acetylmuramoyl-tripeptide--D-alanyl-D-alanine ligase
MNAATDTAGPAFLQSEFTTVAVDSREVKAGDLFFALSQPDYKNNCFNGNFEDSHQFVTSAFESGAIAAVVRPDRFEKYRVILEKFRDRLLFVPDAIKALQDLAHGVYLEWNKPVVAVTGSAGKTTAKELTAHVLRANKLRVLSNAKNYNNGLGHPLTVLRILAEGPFDLAVLEMGMSTPQHEIARLCRITPPDVAVELNVLPVHLEHLGTIERIQQAKAELVEGMKSTGTAVLNADDPRVFQMREKSPRFITYGIENTADVTATDIRFKRFGDTSFSLNISGESAAVLFQLSGRHNILNALAAASVASLYGMSAMQISLALASMKPPAQRGTVLHFAAGFSVIDDSYNSNPDALQSMIKTIVEGAGAAKRLIVIAGEMLELGPEAAAIHLETGRRIGKSGVNVLYGVRGLAEHLVEGAKSAGLVDARFFAEAGTAGDELCEDVREGDLILVKGSRGVRTEAVIEKLTAKFELERP